MTCSTACTFSAL